MPILLTIHPSLAQEQQQHLVPLMQGWDGQFENFISMPGSLAQHVGALLMNMLIPGLDEGVKSLLAAQQEAQAQETTVQLSLVSEAAEVQALPWELLFHPELKFLTTHPDFTFLRRFARPDDEARVPAPLPLRVLLCIASPEDLDPERSRLDFENEENFLFEQIADAYGRGVIDIDVAEDGTLKTLEQRLMSQHYHILHLSMHGRMTEAGPVLAFEDDATGRTRLVEPETLLSLWKKGASRVPCIVLSACQTAQADTERAIPSFTQVLIQQGVPHVIGMRRSVADTAATYFAGYFYRAVAEGLPIDRAVVEARRAVQQQGLGMQWTVPALFSRKASLACADAEQPFTPVRGYLPKMLQIGDVAFQQEGFIGRRATIRRHYRKWADGQTPYLLFHGTGGVGKTTIAGHFAFRYLREHKNARIFALAPPFEADRMEALLDDAFKEVATPEDLEKNKIIDDVADRLAFMIRVLGRQPCIFIFDNLETGLDLKSLAFTADYAPLVRCLNAVLTGRQPHLRALLTCRYIPQDPHWAGLTTVQLPEALLGDVLRFMRNFAWPQTVTSEQRREIYQQLGGNFRSVSWVAGLLSFSPTTWEEIKKRVALVAPQPDTPEAALETVKTAMRRDLVLEVVLDQLTLGDRRLLRQLGLSVAPVIDDALHMLRQDPPLAASNAEDPGGLRPGGAGRRRLVEPADTGYRPWWPN